MLAERMAKAEKTLTDAIAAQNESLSVAMRGQTERMTQSLGATSAEIKERLAVIDAARGNIEALGAQVGTLSSILGNKQARGAKGMREALSRRRGGGRAGRWSWR